MQIDDLLDIDNLRGVGNLASATINDTTVIIGGSKIANIIDHKNISVDHQIDALSYERNKLAAANANHLLVFAGGDILNYKDLRKGCATSLVEIYDTRSGLWYHSI